MPDFPPLFSGRATAGDPCEAAIAAAREGCDGGLILWRPSETTLDAALVLAPDVPLAEAAAMLLVAGNGFADAFGALAPAEIAFHLDWPGGFRVEGGRCGGVRAAAPFSCAPEEVPGWLVLCLTVPLIGDEIVEPGLRPDETTLRAEGVALAPDDLLAAWARHTLSWTGRWEDEGLAPVHRHWLVRAWGLGRPMAVTTAAGPRGGIFQGLDERGGILLKGERGAELVPLTDALERRRC